MLINDPYHKNERMACVKINLRSFLHMLSENLDQAVLSQSEQSSLGTLLIDNNLEFR